MDRQIQLLIDSATPLLCDLSLAQSDMTAGTVAAAIMSKSGRVFTGICVDVSCGIGFCAEHAAVAEMLKGRETEIIAAVAVCKDVILAPCGRCRELMVQVNPKNLAAKIALPDGSVSLLSDLLPHHWMDTLSIGSA